MKMAVQRGGVRIEERGNSEQASSRPMLRVVEAPERFRGASVSTLSVTLGRDGCIAHRANILPEHRAELAAWLERLARRIGAPD
jgi:hypothetical protein